MVELVSRPVEDFGGIYVGAHTFFEVIPDHPDQIQMQGLPYGTTAFTLGAYPNQLSNPFTSQLVKGMGTNDSLNYDSEYAFGNKPIISSTVITPPNGESDTAFIDSLGAAYNSTDVNGVPYWLLGNVPGFYNGNSNNFTYTLGTKVGVQSQMNAFASQANGNALGGAAGYQHTLPTTSILSQIASALTAIEGTINSLISSNNSSSHKQ